MKISVKKSIVVGSVFVAAMNFNACAYGSPQSFDNGTMGPIIADMVESASIESTDAEVNNAEQADL